MILATGGTVISYKQLALQADAFAHRLGATRRLVILEARNTIESMVAFLGCLRGRHPVILTAPNGPNSSESSQTALLCAFRPYAFIRSSGGNIAIDLITPDACALHPDLSILLSTSGSTGTAKLVKLSRRNIQSNAESIKNYLSLTPRDRAITSLQFNYSYGLSVVTSHLTAGASIVLSEASIADTAFWDAFRRNSVTSFSSVPYGFELLLRQDFDFAKLTQLRFVTQAGGKLQPETVKKLAAMGMTQGWEFFVMYGQTEAAPRIAFLPPHLAVDSPDCIGIAIPGGTLSVLDDGGNTIDAPNIVGELCYRGPNVMMGYAMTGGDLASADHIDWLRTGDLACRNEAGLFRIVGRKARFVKPFGYRVNLDELENELRKNGADVRVAGTDDTTAVAFRRRGDLSGLPTPIEIGQRTGLPPSIFKVIEVDAMPSLANGKPDYVKILGLVSEPSAQPDSRSKKTWSRFPSLFWSELLHLAGLREAKWDSVLEAFEALLRRPKISPDDSFSSLHGDSLSYVEIALALEDLMTPVPADWPNLTIAELERHRSRLDF